MKKTRGTLRTEAGKFLRWRKARGGRVEDMRSTRDLRGIHRQTQGRSDTAAPVDTVFARNEREGRYA